MKINAFCPNKGFAQILKDSLQNELGELSLVVIEYVEDGGIQKMDNFAGLDIALSFDPKEAPIVICSFLPETYFSTCDKGNSEKFHSLMGKRRVGFIQLPFSAETLLYKYQELSSDEKEEDILAIEFEKINSFEREMASIHHNVYRRVVDTVDYTDLAIIKGIKDSRAIGLSGSDEEIILQIKNFKHKPKNSIFAGRFFPGVFCDIEGTLFKNGEINVAMLEKLKELSAHKPITLWTGGNLEEIKKTLALNGITWKLIPKDDLTGAEVEIAFDDEDFSVFFEKYGVKVKNFNKI